MSGKRALVFSVALLCLLVLAPAALYSQSTAGSVAGDVVDPQKAAVPGATVTLTQHGTNTVFSTVTDSGGRYAFPAVTPADYTLKVTAKGFRATEIAQVAVLTLKSYTYDITLELGAATEVVEIKETMGADLVTTDASVGTVLSGETLIRLPSFQRQVTAFLGLQPGTSPFLEGDDTNGGSVNGSLPEQTTFLVDGGDATSDLEGTNGYVSPPGEQQPAPFIAVPAESIQEFRVVTANPTSDFSRSVGGEVSLLTKQGTNTLHGSLYEYYYGSGTSANSWQLNSVGRARPHSVNNRFGASAGGAAWKDKLFFYGDFEERRFNQATTITQLVPTATARMGILQFPDSTGAVVPYNLNPANGPISTLCGPAQNLPCDDRAPASFPAGFVPGVDPTILTNYFALLPTGNNPAKGDGLNSIGFTASFPQVLREDIGILRADYNISPRWSFFTTFHYNKYVLPTNAQFNITTGTTPQLISSTPVEPRFVTFMLTGQIGSHFTSQTHGSYLRDWWGWNRAVPASQLPCAAGATTGCTLNALQISGEHQLAGTSSSSKVWGDPINFDTQNGRSRLWFGKDYYVAQDSSWLHGKHLIQFGGSYYLWNLVHLRTDVVTGGLTQFAFNFVGQTTHNGGSFLNIPATEIPAFCGGTITTNCLVNSKARNRWSNMYSTLLGLSDRSTQVGVRDGNFTANPLGSPLIDHVRTHTFDTYFQDVWKFKPSITITYGLTYGVQFAPTERDGKQVVEVFAASNTPLENLLAYLAKRHAALSSGQFFATGLTAATDATFGFTPIRHLPGRTSSGTTAWNNFGPRVAVAWQVPYHNFFFGNNQTVIRAGYSILWNRTNAVGEALLPLLGNGLASVQQCQGPTFNGTATATCSGGAVTAANGFRIGVDGNAIPVPGIANASIPLVPGSPFAVSRSFSGDPLLAPPYAHMVSMDIQRAFPHNWLLDIGYIGRYSRDLHVNVDINASDPGAATPACTANGTTCQITTTGETLAQAYNNVNTGSLAEPFFENAPFGFPGGTVAAAGDAGDPSLATFMLLNYDLAAPRPLDPLQAVINNQAVGGGSGDYNALFVSVRKSMSQGLDLTANYTWSHSVSTAGEIFLNTNQTGFSPPSSFDLLSGKASNNGDRRHVINGTAYYELPFGRGKMFSPSNNIVNRIIDGWSVSGIYQWATGLPVCIGADGDFGAIDGFTCAVGASLFGKSGLHNLGTPSATCTVGCNGNLNTFANPTAVFNSLRAPLPGVDGRPGAESTNSPRQWSLDFAVGKKIAVTERYKVVVNAEFFNVFNHPLLGVLGNNGNGLTSLDLGDPRGFGVINGADNRARVIQLGLRFEF